MPGQTKLHQGENAGWADFDFVLGFAGWWLAVIILGACRASAALSLLHPQQVLNAVASLVLWWAGEQNRGGWAFLPFPVELQPLSGTATEIPLPRCSTGQAQRHSALPAARSCSTNRVSPQSWLHFSHEWSHPCARCVCFVLILQSSSESSRMKGAVWVQDCCFYLDLEIAFLKIVTSRLNARPGWGNTALYTERIIRNISLEWYPECELLNLPGYLWNRKSYRRAYVTLFFQKNSWWFFPAVPSAKWPNVLQNPLATFPPRTSVSGHVQSHIHA